MYWDREWVHFPKSTPRKAKGGIKAQSKSGTFGKSWWAKRWIAVLESFNIGARLGRGRSYARKGQVLDIDIKKGTITAGVQGSRPRPYKVTIKVATLSKSDWEKLAESLSKQAIYSAKLFAGEMPEDIEEVFTGVGLSLFPQKLKDLITECSCPDWSNPCKHIAAVYYLLGEEFDSDPFLIFKLRGMAREELVGIIGNENKKDLAKGYSVPITENKPEPAQSVEPLPTQHEAFWGIEGVPSDIPLEVRIPPVNATLPKSLGKFPFWRSENNFIDSMENSYRLASPVGLDIFLGKTILSSDD